MKYLSLFTGVGGFELAIHNTLEKAECVAWSDVDKYAIEVFKHRFPMLIDKNLGDINGVIALDNAKNFSFFKERLKGFNVYDEIPNFDLLVGGSPCTDLSIAKGNRQGLKGNKSQLFWSYVEILKKKKPKYFLLENVASMSKEDRDIITKTLGVEPIEINSDRFTPQKRRRLYWFNWELTEELPEEGDRWPELVAWSRSTRYKDKDGRKYSGPGPGRESYVEEREIRDGRANTCTTGTGCGSFSSKNFREIDGEKIPLHPDDCEALQGFPEGWTEIVSDSQRYKQIGNAVTVPVIEFILRGIK